MSFNDILNQEKAKEIIIKQLKSKKLPHAYLFIGQEGIGRRKTAIELAKALNCIQNINKEEITDSCGQCIACQKIDNRNHPDVTTIDFKYQAALENKEIEKQKIIKIDTIRAFQKEISLKPIEGKWKIFIIDPAEKMNIEAANCLLKTLEEPAPWTIIILLAKHKENLPATIISRTQLIFFRPLEKNTVSRYIKDKYKLDESRLRNILEICEGSISKAVLMAEQAEENEIFSNDSCWQLIKLKKLSLFNLFELSQQKAKTASDFLNNLLLEIKNDFHLHPDKFMPAIEAVMESKKLLERNVNPQMLLDALLIKLNKEINPDNPV